jgi:hypothetical protein
MQSLPVPDWGDVVAYERFLARADKVIRRLENWVTQAKGSAYWSIQEVDETGRMAAELKETIAKSRALHVADVRNAGKRPVLTYAVYQKLKEGESYGSACLRIGFPGKETARSKHFDTVTYSWENSDSGNMIATFQNGKLVSKAQSGLK